MNRIVLLGIAVVVMLGAPGAVSAQEEGKFYHLKNVDSGMCIAVDAGSKEKGAKIVIAEFADKGGAQQWKFVKSGEFFKIINRHSTMGLNVPGASAQKGLQIIQWDNSEQNNYLWKVEKLGDHVAITSRSSTLYLDVDMGKKDVGTAVIQHEKSKRNHQLWDLVPIK